MSSTDLDTPPPTSPSRSLPSSSSPRSGLDEMFARAPGAAVHVYALSKLSPLLWLPYADPRWRWVLLTFAAIVLPMIVPGALRLAQRALSKQR